jgi:hypothetical protein
MLSSHEIRQHLRHASGFKAFGAKAAHRHRVRSAEADGVQEHGEASPGLTWNTGDPSLLGETTSSRAQVDTGLPTTKGRSAGDGAAVRKAEHRPHPIPTARRQTKRMDEESGSLSSRIVAQESWRTGDGLEPVSSKGGCPERRTSAWNHAHNPLRK